MTNIVSKHLQVGLVILVSVFALIVGIFAVMPQVGAASSTYGKNEHLVTIHDRGVERSLISRNNTLRDVLNEADISLDSKDIVEPGLDEKLVSASYQVNIYRARPIVIQDGISRIRVLSAYQTPEQVAKEANLKLHDEDEATFGRSTNMVADGASTVLTIKRATPIRLVLYGKQETVYTQSKTIADFLQEKKIELGAKDTMSVKPVDSVYSGMKIEIWHNGKQTVTRDQKIGFDIEEIKDANHEVGYRKITTLGVVGKKSVTYEITMRNGKEVKRKKIQSVVILKAKKQVIVVGAKQKVFGGSCSSWIAGAGISDTTSANYLIGVESGCNPNAVNAGSGACGVGQELPCGKSGCELGDGACQTKWMNSYVLGRYGSWANAANHHRSSGWY